MTYTQRLNYFTKPRTWEVMVDRICWSEEGRGGEVLFGEIMEVQLKFAPTRTERERIVMKIRTQSGCLEISNIDWKGPLSSDNQKDDFVEFVDGLHDRLAVFGVETIFSTGSSMGAYVGNWILTVFVSLVLVGAGLFFLISGMPYITLVKILLILFYFPTLYRFMKRSYPRRYNPNTVPWDRVIS